MKSLACYKVFFITSLVLCLQQDTDYFLHIFERCHHQHHSCASGPSNIYCSCDRRCIYYDDCCFDAAAITGKLDATSEQVYHQYLEMMTCQSITFKSNAIIRQGVFMISSCPVSWDDNIDTRKSCELDIKHDIRDMLPVFDMKSNLTFKNRQCAECHRVQNYIPWSLEITCLSEIVSPSSSVIEVLMKKIHSDECRYRFIPPKDHVVTLHYCYQEFDYTVITNTLGLVLNSTCSNRVLKPLVVAIGYTLLFFRNLQCLIDNDGLMYPAVLEDIHCVLQSEGFDLSESGTLSSLIDFSSMLRFRQAVAKCTEEEIQLSDEVGCQRLYCPAFSEPSGGECVNITHTTNGLMLDLWFESNTEPPSPHQFNLIFIRILDSLLGNGTRSSIHFQKLNRNTAKLIPGTHLNSGNPCSIAHLIVPLKNISNGVPIDSQRSLIANIVKNYSQRNPDGSIIKHIENIQNMTCYSNVSISNPLYLVDLISVDNDLPCPAVKLQYSGNESDSEVLIRDMLSGTSNESAYFHLSGVIISPMDVVYANGDYFVCIDSFSSKYQRVDQEYNNLDDYRSIINTVCTSLSIICLVYCLLQYCVIPSLRDGKSDLLIVLIILLLLAQTFSLLLPIFAASTLDCTWFGMIHHFSWLCAFMFICLCSFRLNTEIRSLKTYSKSERSIATVKYMLVGFSIPLVVVLCTKITNELIEPTEKWYGGPVCFISQILVLFLAFVVPVLLILCGNVVLFICIIHYISSTSLSTSTNKSNVIIFMKISTFMGFSWIIGIVAILSHSDILLLVFEILSNLQGTFITISFSCTNRVRTFYKDCARQKEDNT